jgi:transcriptional regulator with XRE-family HTH domain
MTRHYKTAFGPVTGSDVRDFSRHLHALMAERGWNQSELARRAFGTVVKDGREVPQKRDRVSEWVNAIAFPSEENMKAMAKAFGIEVEQLAPNIGRAPVDRGTARLAIAQREDGRWHVQIDDVFTTEQLEQLQKLLREFRAATDNVRGLHSGHGHGHGGGGTHGP